MCQTSQKIELEKSIATDHEDLSGIEIKDNPKHIHCKGS